jgi:hypothetical protein
MPKPEKKIVQRKYDWQRKPEEKGGEVELAVVGPSATNIKGWEAGEGPSKQKFGEYPLAPESIEASAKKIQEKSKEITDSKAELQKRVEELTVVLNGLKKQIEELEKKGKKELQPMVQSFYEEVKLKTPELGNAALDSLQEVGHIVMKLSDNITAIGVKIAILQTVEQEPDAEEKLKLITEYLTTHHKKIYKEIEEFLKFSKKVCEEALPGRVLIKKVLDEQYTISKAMLKYLKKEYPVVYKSALLTNAKTPFELCNLSNLSYIREDLNNYRNKVKKIFRKTFFTESFFMDVFDEIKNGVISFLAKLKLIDIKGNTLIEDINNELIKLSLIDKMLDGKVEVSYVQKFI